MEKNEIITACKQVVPAFLEILRDERYQLRGVLNSEALLIIAVAKHFGVKSIIESGRARGHSTNLLAKYFQSTPEIRILSIDLDNHSQDAKYSEKYLQKFNNLTLIYGDSFEVIPKSICGDCIIFIDGPKGEDALELCSNLLLDSRVKAVLIHDLHKNVFPRDIAELIYTSTFFSDDEDFVKAFKALDDDCWSVMKSTNYSPYVRDGKSVLSYGHTLGAIFNSTSPFKQPVHDNYLERREYTKPTLKRILIEKMFSIIHKIRLTF